MVGQTSEARAAEIRRVNKVEARQLRRRIANMRRAGATPEEIEQVRVCADRDRSLRTLRGGSNRVRRLYGVPFQPRHICEEPVMPAPFDDHMPSREQLPRSLEAVFVSLPGGVTHLAVNGRPAGRPLSDHGRDAGYRWHNALHVAFAACLGWSPVLRGMVGSERLSDPLTANTQDGPAARATEEQIAWMVFCDARSRSWYAHQEPGKSLLRQIRRTVTGLEVADRTDTEWAYAIRTGVACLRDLWDGDGGTLYGDAAISTLDYVPAYFTPEAAVPPVLAVSA